MQNIKFNKTNNTIQDKLQKQKFFVDIITSSANHTCKDSYRILHLSNQAKRVLETVLKQDKESQMPLSDQDFVNLVKSVLLSKERSSVNIASQIRSVIHLAIQDIRLETLIIRDLGFSIKNRNFHRDSTSNELQEQENDENRIGVVFMKDFLIGLGLAYDLFPNDEAQRLTTQTLQLQNTDPVHENLFSHMKGMDNKQQLHDQASLISPLFSQQEFEFKQIESQSIVKVFCESQIRSLEQPSQIFDTSQADWKQHQEDPECDELIAREDIQIQDSFPKLSHQQQNHNENRFVSHQGLQSMLSNLQNIQQSQARTKTQTPKVQLAQEKPKMNIPTQIHDQLFQSQYLKLMSEHQSLLSVENSKMNTPFKPISKYESINQLFPHNSETKKLSKNLFAPMTQVESPKMTPAVTHTYSSRDPFSSDPKNILYSNIKEPIGLIGQKRMNQTSVKNLERSVANDNILGYHTPLHAINHKRSKIDFTSEKKESNFDKEDDISESEDEKVKEDNCDNDDKRSVNSNRKKRGLKILSVKVQELVFKKQSTTYKDVANELIKQLRENKKKMQEITGMDDFSDADGDDDDFSDESPKKKNNAENDSASAQQKWEKNVRRRVYDALNVLYAAGVLKKEGKHVSCDNRILQLINKPKDQKENTPSVKSNQSAKAYPSQADQRIMKHIEVMKQQLSTIEYKVKQKKSLLTDQFKHMISYKHLIKRNQEFEYPDKYLPLPFILIATKDTSDNEVELSFGEKNKTLNISMKKHMKCVGDADVLVNLDLFKVSKDWMQQNYPEGQEVLRLLDKRQCEHILI